MSETAEDMIENVRTGNRTKAKTILRNMFREAIKRRILSQLDEIDGK